MKIALLSSASSIHTVQWAQWLNKAGHEIHIISQHPLTESLMQGITLHKIPYRGILGYFTMVPRVKKILKQIKPDIVNAHYASGYGTTARVVNYQPWLLSVWGSDVYDFPYTSPLHKWLVKTNLYAANAVASTSVCMAKQTRIIAPKLKDIAITPFGVDIQIYRNVKPAFAHNNKQIVVGTVKTMASKYGIDILIEAFAILFKRFQKSDKNIADRLTLRLVGDGPEIKQYKQQVERLKISNRVEFVGRVPHSQVPQELAKFDIFAALSRLDSESFGVAVIEASATARPVVVSDVGGLPEVVLANKTGFIVPREDSQAAAVALEKLVLNPKLRQRVGLAGRGHVEKTYNWPRCVEQMVKVYSGVVSSYKLAYNKAK
ncbi:MAG TPA: glycosyltransferase [Turneriella sp.]|nr:glycosyltransferase [Turneriella sp.]